MKKQTIRLQLDTKLILLGQILTVTGTLLLSLGQIFRLLREDNLPTQPMLPKAEQQESMPNRGYYKKSYFD